MKAVKTRTNSEHEESCLRRSLPGERLALYLNEPLPLEEQEFLERGHGSADDSETDPTQAEQLHHAHKTHLRYNAHTLTTCRRRVNLSPADTRTPTP